MTKRPLLFILIATLALTGCVASGPSVDDAKNKKTTQFAFPPPPEEPRFYFERMLRSSADVVSKDDSNSLMQALTGQVTAGEGLAKPYSVAVRHGRVYVSDTAARGVAVFDIPNKKYLKIGKEEDENGHGLLRQPIGIDLDKAGNLYVLDAKLKQVMVYTDEGKFLRSFGGEGVLYKPAGLAVTPDGTRVYAVDIGGSSSNEHKIVVFNGITGERLPDIGKRGGDHGEFNLPRDAAIAPDGSIYVVDGGNFRVQKFDKEGKFLSTFGEIGRQPGQFSRPKEIAIDPSGNIYVVDTAFGNFQIFNPAGQLLMAVGERANSNAPGKYSLPAGIAVDDDGRVYVVDQFFHKVEIYRPASVAADEGWVFKGKPLKALASTEPIKDSPPASSK